VIVLSMRPERATPVRESASEGVREYLRLMGQSLGQVARSRMLAWVIGYSAIVFVLVRSGEYLYQPYLDERGFSVSEIGFTFAGLSLLASFAAHRGDALRRLFGEDTLVYGLLALLSLSFLLLEQLHGDIAPLCMLAVQAVAIGVYSPLVKTMLNRQIHDSNRRATILSVESIARRMAKGLFAPVAGYVGASSAMYLCGGIGVAGLVLLMALSARMVPTMGRLSDPAIPVERDPQL
jgi:hypothetical protein